MHSVWFVWICGRWQYPEMHEPTWESLCLCSWPCVDTWLTRVWRWWLITWLNHGFHWTDCGTICDKQTLCWNNDWIQIQFWWDFSASGSFNGHSPQDNPDKGKYPCHLPSTSPLNCQAQYVPKAEEIHVHFFIAKPGENKSKYLLHIHLLLATVWHYFPKNSEEYFSGRHTEKNKAIKYVWKKHLK